MLDGSYYRPYCYYVYKGEKRYFRQVSTVIADGKSLGLKKPLTFLTAYRYSDDATLPDDDIIISGMRTKTLLTANNLPVDAPDVKGKKLRLFMLKRENAEKQMTLAVNPYNNQYDFLPDGLETNSIRRLFLDGKNGMIIHDLNNIITLKTSTTADKSTIELQSNDNVIAYSYSPFRWYAGESLKSITADVDGTIRIGDMKITREHGMYPGDTVEMKYPTVIAIDWGSNE
jgi:hypothetical protein